MGIASYSTIAGTTYAIVSGTTTVQATSVPGFSLENQTGTAPAEAPVYSFANADSSGAGAIMYSGKATAGSTGCLIEVADSTLSGTPGGEIFLNAAAIQIGAAAQSIPYPQLQTQQGAAGATYSQSFTQGTVNRVNTIITQLHDLGITI